DDRLRESRMGRRADRDHVRNPGDGALVRLHGRAHLGPDCAVAVRNDRPHGEMNEVKQMKREWNSPGYSSAALKQKLGDFQAPKGLYESTKQMPFLGRVACNVDGLVAGEWNEIVLDYEVGGSGMADGAWFKATFKFYSDWALRSEERRVGKECRSRWWACG